MKVKKAIFKLNILWILLGICLMEKALFRLSWVEESSIVPFFMACMVFVMAKKKLMTMDFDRLMQSIKCRRGVCIMVTALLFSFFTVLGSIRVLYSGSGLRILFDTAVTFAGLAFLFAVFLVYAYDLMDSALAKNGSSERGETSEGPFSGRTSIKRYVIYVIICMVGWIPLFMRFYPGSFGADSINQIRQAMHLMPYGNHLPVISTWLIELLYSIGFSLTGQVNAALAFYTVFQMILTACTYAGCLCYLEKRRVPRAAVYTVLGFFALVPMIAMYAIYIHKDTPAADLMLLLIIFLDYLIHLHQ